jgi:hypothetical protein
MKLLFGLLKTEARPLEFEATKSVINLAYGALQVSDAELCSES